MKGRGWIARQGQTRGGVWGCSLPREELDISPKDEGNPGKGRSGIRATDGPLWSQRGDESRVRETRESGVRVPRGRWGPGVASCAVDTGVRGTEEREDCVPSRIS